MKWPSHGANPQYLTDPLQLSEVTYDFSVNVNPLGPPSWLREKWGDFFELITNYPDPFAEDLRRTIALQEGISEKQILVGNGASELLTLIGREFAGKHLLIVEPTFSEYRMIAEMNGCIVESIFLTESEGWELPLERLKSKLTGVDLVMICNPNNPTGVAYKQSKLVELLNELEKREVSLLIDEAFYDFVQNEPSLIQQINKSSHLIILRSLTKMYAIPGLRIGYLAGSEAIVQKLASHQPTWSVNALAQDIAKGCIKDHSYRQQTRDLIQAERERIFLRLKELAFTVSKSDVNYYLLGGYPSLSDTLLPFLLKNRLAVRHTHNFPGLNGDYVRLAIRTPRENDCLLDLLKRWVQT
ncbi:pyridoxal phosphate-dependent class II aminotransferase [Halobacillus shinanisalinarum]|uniref:Aminotransferase n=1 Tax=Halobacillus shinanisalinarum TaxID=2932258 RepID=A0ABY4H8U2_9BACI|nr:threonine-phosphate decarboxylase [Halobacillus shinanisalinarum]UOQ95407.1 pyridoxal phosphate-dependent class II aminotransferase [Halobacillus shinanisalinarum]